MAKYELQYRDLPSEDWREYSCAVNDFSSNLDLYIDMEDVILGEARYAKKYRETRIVRLGLFRRPAGIYRNTVHVTN